MKFLKKSLKILIITIFLSIFLITGLYLYARTIPKLDINNTGSYYLYDINDELFFQDSSTREEFESLKAYKKDQEEKLNS